MLGLNGALQRRVELSGPLAVGSVNRAASSSSGVGGKGQGAWLAMQQLAIAESVDESARARLAQFIGSGDEGEALVHPPTASPTV